MSMFGAHFLKHVNDFLRVDEELDMQFVEAGYLFLASSAGEHVLRENHATQM